MQTVLCRRLRALYPVRSLDTLDYAERSLHVERHVALGSHVDLAVVGHRDIRTELEHGKLRIVTFGRHELYGTVACLRIGVGIDADTHECNCLAVVVDGRISDLLGLDPFGSLDAPVGSRTHLNVERHGLIGRHDTVYIAHNEYVSGLIDFQSLV